MDIKAARRRLQGSVPHIGQRIIKTAIAVYVCFVVNILFRDYGINNMSVDAAITAVICMQNTMHDVKRSSFNRIIGTLIGAVWGLLFLHILWEMAETYFLVCYLVVSVGVVLAIYSTVVLKKADAAALSAIVFLCVVGAFTSVENPVEHAFGRLLDVFIGTSSALLVNLIRFPKRTNMGCVFFVKTRDLGPDSYVKASPAVLYQLRTLFDRGAKLCLISEHAPAFIAHQISTVNPTVPMIVMDGAAIYDSAESEYLFEFYMTVDNSRMAREALDKTGCNYFTYTVHHNKTCIFHHGDELNELEKKVYDRLKKTPYRSYFNEEIFEEKEIVYFKMIDTEDNIIRLENLLTGMLPPEHFRIVRHRDDTGPKASALYIYDAMATVENAKKKLLSLIPNGSSMTPVDVSLPGGFRYPNDALHVLSLVDRRFEQPFFIKKP